MWYSDTDAQDPLFLLHHANVDRLWASWGQYYGTNPTTDTQWMKQSFTFCEDTGQDTGRLVTRKTETVLKTDDLGYSYDSLVRPQVPIPLPNSGLAWTLLARGTPPANLLERESRVPLQLTRRQ